MTKKRNFLRKFWLKLTNTVRYCREYKGMGFVQKTENGDIIKSLGQSIDGYKPEKFKKRADAFNEILKEKQNKHNNIDHEKDYYTFKHSGHTGDIIYSIPALIALVKNKKAKFWIDISMNSPYKSDEQHPAGNTTINQKMVNMLKPLLLAQPYIQEVEVYPKGQKVDYDFDAFRDIPVMHDRGHISRWYFYVFNVHSNLSKKWIDVTPDFSYKDTIVLARSQRYNNPELDYSFLSQYPNIVFLGINSEYQIMKQAIPTLEFKPVNDFLEMAQIIAGCKFFIGNQSFPYSLAEAMDVPRLLEIYYDAPNVIPNTNKGFDFYFQKHFELLVEKMNDTPKNN